MFLCLEIAVPKRKNYCVFILRLINLFFFLPRFLSQYFQRSQSLFPKGMQRYTLFITAQIFFLKFLIFYFTPPFLLLREKGWKVCRAVQRVDLLTRFTLVFVQGGPADGPPDTFCRRHCYPFRSFQGAPGAPAGGASGAFWAVFAPGTPTFGASGAPPLSRRGGGPPEAEGFRR